jgi:pimeloyl-ACP methyl ester carboxylesterase
MAETHLHYEVHDGGGPPALFVHGMFGGRGLWQDNVEPLRAVCSPVVVELYGHGRSPTPADPAAYTPASYLAEFERIRTAVGAEQWWLVGHSLGAALTLRYSLEWPDRTAGQVFTNSMSGLADEDWQAQMATDAEKFADQIERAGPAGIRANRINPAHSRRVTERVRETLLADEARLDPAGIANAIRWTTPTSSVRSRMAEIRVPTLLIVGERERAFAPHRDYIAQANPAVVIESVSCGHAPNAERPADFNRLVASFIGPPGAA